MKYFLIALLLLTVSCGKNEPLKSLDQGKMAAPPELVTFKIKGYRPQSGKTFQNLFVSNFSVKTRQGLLSYSSSRDGLTDEVKRDLNATYGFGVSMPESVVPFFADLVLFLAGIDLRSQPLLYCASNQQASSANDALIYRDNRLSGNPVTFLGLRDCEKVYLGLDPKKFDYNSNGIPDYLELQCGMNPANPSQAFVSTAGDGVSDIDKCKRHIPIDESASLQPNQTFAYKYEIQANADGSSDFTISNIPVLNGGADNFIAFYVTESDGQTGLGSLYTAFTILKGGSAGATFTYDYWATSPSKFFNSEYVNP